jgi:hypothetical protein
MSLRSAKRWSALPLFGVRQPTEPTVIWRRWPMASLSLLTLVIIVGAAMAAWG